MATYSGKKQILNAVGIVDITTAEAVEQGDLVTADGYKADGNDDKLAEFVALQDCASSGLCQCAAIAVVDGMSSLSGAGYPLHLSDTDGDPSEDQSTTAPQRVGMELSTTAALLAPMLCNFTAIGTSGDKQAVTTGAKFAVWYLSFSGASASEGLYINITDAQTRASGTCKGIHLDYTSSGVTTGGSIYAVDFGLTVSAGAFTYVWGQQIALSFSGTYSAGQVYGLFIYQGAFGANGTVANAYGISIGVNNTNAVSGNIAAIRVYCHGGTAGSVIHCANSSGTPFTHLVDFEGQVSPVASATGETMTITHKIAVKVHDTTLYLQAGTMA